MRFKSLLSFSCHAASLKNWESSLSNCSSQRVHIRLVQIILSMLIAVVLDNKFKMGLIYRGSVSDPWHRERLPCSLRLCSGPCGICETCCCCKKCISEAAWDVLDLAVTALQTGVRYSKHTMKFYKYDSENLWEDWGESEKRGAISALDCCLIFTGAYACPLAH